MNKENKKHINIDYVKRTILNSNNSYSSLLNTSHFCDYTIIYSSLKSRKNVNSKVKGIENNIFDLINYCNIMNNNRNNFVKYLLFNEYENHLDNLIRSNFSFYGNTNDSNIFLFRFTFPNPCSSIEDVINNIRNEEIIDIDYNEVNNRNKFISHLERNITKSGPENALNNQGYPCKFHHYCFVVTGYDELGNGIIKSISQFFTFVSVEHFLKINDSTRRKQNYHLKRQQYYNLKRRIFFDNVFNIKNSFHPYENVRGLKFKRDFHFLINFYHPNELEIPRKKNKGKQPDESCPYLLDSYDDHDNNMSSSSEATLCGNDQDLSDETIHNSYYLDMPSTSTSHLKYEIESEESEESESNDNDNYSSSSSSFTYVDSELSKDLKLFNNTLDPFNIC